MDVTRGELRHFHDVVRTELADGIEIPPDFDRPLFVCVFLRLADFAPDAVKFVAEPLNDACADRHFGVRNGLPVERLHHAACDESVIGWPSQAARDELEAFEKASEIGERP